MIGIGIGIGFNNNQGAQVAENLLTFTEAFDNIAWGKSQITVAADDTTDPDGGSAADKIIEDVTTSGLHFVTRTETADPSISHTLSVYVKNAGRGRVFLQLADNAAAANRFDATFTLSTPAAGTPNLFGNASDVTAGVTDAGSGWVRCWISGKANNAGSSLRVRIYLDDGTGVSYNGDGTSGLYLWGAQLEVRAGAPLDYVSG